MVGNIVLFMVGAGIGGGLVAYHEHRVKAAVQAERRDYFRIDRVEELRRQETRP